MTDDLDYELDPYNGCQNLDDLIGTYLASRTIFLADMEK